MEGQGEGVKGWYPATLSMRNFSKFQAMSERATGDHSVSVVPPKPPRGSTCQSQSQRRAVRGKGKPKPGGAAREGSLWRRRRRRRA